MYGHMLTHYAISALICQAATEADINLNPAHRHHTYPRVVKRAWHNSYRVKRPGDNGTYYAVPPAIRLVNLPAAA
jgi:hypothetical protein